MVIYIIIAVLMVVMGVLILAGKGDNLIAGYNTAPKREREKVNIKRLRRLTGITLFLLALFCVIPALDNSPESILAFGALVFILCIVAVVLANTWAMKKK